MEYISRFFVFVYVLVLSPLFFSLSIYASDGKGAAYHDLGIFSLESGEFGTAEKQFMRAIEAEPDNPYYRHSLGRVYLKTGKYQEALLCFKKIMKKNPEIIGLKFDMAFAAYKLEDYKKAATIFTEIADEDPKDALSRYHAGMSIYKSERYTEAPGHLIRASRMSPSLRPHCRYTIGVCNYKTDKLKEALDMFTLVVDDPEAGELKNKARDWINAVRKKQKAAKPWSLYAKLGRRYDDNVRLDPLDKDIEGDESDYITSFNFSGKYSFLKKNRFSAGVGYVHYQIMHDSLGEFDLAGAMFKLFAQYRMSPFDFKLTLSPSQYWLDSDRYQRRYEFKPEASWKISDTITTHFAFRFSDDTNFKEDGESGELLGFFLKTRIKVPKISGHVFGGAGWETFDANQMDESLKAWKAKAGLFVGLPMDFDLSVSAEFSDNKYKIDADCNCEKRDDEKWHGNLSISRHIVYEWLRFTGAYGFTKRKSNYIDKRYERNKITVSLAVRF